MDLQNNSFPEITIKGVILGVLLATVLAWTAAVLAAVVWRVRRLDR